MFQNNRRRTQKKKKKKRNVRLVGYSRRGTMKGRGMQFGEFAERNSLKTTITLLHIMNGQKVGLVKSKWRNEKIHGLQLTENQRIVKK